MTEQEAQAKIIDYYLRHYSRSELTVILEMPFCEYKRRADIVFVVNGLTHAVEIKTLADNTLTLSDQLSDYKKVFDFVYIATEGKNFYNVIKNSYGNAGILRLDRIVSKHRSARQTLRLDKFSLLSSVDFSSIRRHSDSVVRLTKHESISETVKKMTIEECRRLFIDFTCRRYGRRSTLFFDEIGEVVHTDDLLILTRPDANIS